VEVRFTGRQRLDQKLGAGRNLAGVVTRYRRTTDLLPETTMSATMPDMATLLIVHHTPSPALHELFTAVMSGATDPHITDVSVVARPALGATASDVLSADAYILGTPANLGYMSGALKHFFDQIYYPCLDTTIGRPFAMYVHGNNDVGGALSAITKVVTGLRWRQAQNPVEVIGPPTPADRDACWELGAAVAASLVAH
jgi:hypothetical protein